MNLSAAVVVTTLLELNVLPDSNDYSQLPDIR